MGVLPFDLDLAAKDATIGVDVTDTVVNTGTPVDASGFVGFVGAEQEDGVAFVWALDGIGFNNSIVVAFGSIVVAFGSIVVAFGLVDFCGVGLVIVACRNVRATTTRSSDESKYH